jgi:hypothetical protein
MKHLTAIVTATILLVASLVTYSLSRHPAPEVGS